MHLLYFCYVENYHKLSPFDTQFRTEKIYQAALVTYCSKYLLVNTFCQLLVDNLFLEVSIKLLISLALIVR